MSNMDGLPSLPGGRASQISTRDAAQDSDSGKLKDDIDLSLQHLDGINFVTTSCVDQWRSRSIILSTWADLLLPRRSFYHRLLYPRTVDCVLFLRLRFSRPGPDPTIFWTLYRVQLCFAWDFLRQVSDRREEIKTAAVYKATELKMTTAETMSIFTWVRKAAQKRDLVGRVLEILSLWESNSTVPTSWSGDDTKKFWIAPERATHIPVAALIFIHNLSHCRWDECDLEQSDLPIEKIQAMTAAGWASYTFPDSKSPVLDADYNWPEIPLDSPLHRREDEAYVGPNGRFIQLLRSQAEGEDRSSLSLENLDRMFREERAHLKL